MAAARRLKRVVSSQTGFLSFKANSGDFGSSRRKRVNKNKKKNWNKHSDIQDVEEFLDDVRLQERATGGLVAEKSDESLFFLDVGDDKKTTAKAEEPVEGVKRKGKASRPLRIDLILKHDSLIPPPKDILGHQQPNAKKLRRIAQKAEHLAAKGVVPRRQRRLMNRHLVAKTRKTSATEANNNPERPYYNIWGEQPKETADPWYLQQTRKMLVKRPEKMNAKPSVLPAVEVIAPGGSYNPEFFSHQTLLQEAHDVEVKKLKEEQKIAKQVAVKKEDLATEETVFHEQVEGLVDGEEEEELDEEGSDMPVGAISLAEKKTERQRKKEKADKIKEQQRLTVKRMSDRQQQLFQLRSIKASLRQREETTKDRQKQRKANQEAEKSQPRRLGKLKFKAQDLEIQLSDELAGSLRRLKPEGSVLKDRFKSLQKRNLIEPRERAKFVRRHRLKYVEKRAFKEIT